MHNPNSPATYDADLGMYCESPREPDPAHLEFLRILVQHGTLQDDARNPLDENTAVEEAG